MKSLLLLLALLFTCNPIHATNHSTPLYFCSYLSPDYCAGISLTEPSSPVKNQPLQVKSLNSSIAANDTRYLTRLQWYQNNNSEVFLLKNETKKYFLGHTWPYQHVGGPTKIAQILRRDSARAVLNTLGEDPYGRVKINNTELCLTFLQCIPPNEQSKWCDFNRARRIRNITELQRGSYLRWTSCLNETSPSQWFFSLPPTPSPTESPTPSPETPAPTEPGETLAPTSEPTTEAPTFSPTEGRTREYEDPKKEYETFSPETSSPSPETPVPTNTPTPQPTETPSPSFPPETLAPSSNPSLAPTSQQYVCLEPDYCCTLENFNYCFENYVRPWKSKFSLLENAATHV